MSNILLYSYVYMLSFMLDDVYTLYTRIMNSLSCVYVMASKRN